MRNAHQDLGGAAERKGRSAVGKVEETAEKIVSDTATGHAFRYRAYRLMATGRFLARLRVYADVGLCTLS